MSTNMFVIHASSSCVGQVLGSSGHGQRMTEIAKETKRVCLFGACREKCNECVTSQERLKKMRWNVGLGFEPAWRRADQC